MATVRTMEVHLFLLHILLLSQQYEACTEIILRGQDNSITLGRTMDFDIDIQYGFYVEPKGTKQMGVLNHGVPQSCNGEGKIWQSRYKAILVRPLHDNLRDISVDGINEAGLSASTLYLPGYTVYQNVSEGRCHHAISQAQLTSYILGNFDSVEQVKESFRSKTFPDVNGNFDVGHVHQLHYSVADMTGAAIVIEYTADGIKIHDNTMRVVTNSPTYDWHMTNMKHYVHLENKLKPERKYFDAQLTEHTLPVLPASGLLGMPGDYSSASRFIRAGVLVQISEVPETSEEAIVSTFHILNSVDVTIGTVEGRHVPSRTYWQLVKDLTNQCLYYRTYDYLSIRKLCMSDLKVTSGVLPLDNRSETLEDGVEDVYSKMTIIKDEL